MATMKEKAEKNKSKQKKVSGGGGLGKGAGKAGKAATGLGKKLTGALFWLFVGLLIFSLLTGYINQRKTGESIINFYSDASHKISDTATEFVKDPLNFLGLKKTEDGVYLKDAKGPESNGDTDSKEEEASQPVVEGGAE